MKLEEMILVTKNMEGEQANYLTSFNDYLKTIIEINGDKPEDLAHAITELFDTKEKPTYWSEQYIAANITVHARFCQDELQLRGFLFGYYNENNNGEKGFTFDTESCLEECLAVLEAYNMKTDGHIGNASFKYERLEHDFQTGEVVRNLNGNSYRVLDVLTEENILFLSVSSGEINIGLDTKYYAKTPEGEGFSTDSILYGISWGHGIYLGNNITKIDFDEIRREYGSPEQIGTLADYRLSIKKPSSCIRNCWRMIKSVIQSGKRHPAAFMRSLGPQKMTASLNACTRVSMTEAFLDRKAGLFRQKQ